MEPARLPLDGTSFRLPEGELALWSPGQGVLITSLRGNGYAEFAEPITSRVDALLEQHRSVALFFDAGTLERYDTPLRIDLTAHFSKNRHRIARLEVFLRSRIVAMGVSVASLALGGIVRTHTDPKAFRRSLEIEFSERKIVGFSLDVLGLWGPASAAR